MAHAESHTGLIWKVFGFLSLITVVEVILGINKPESIHLIGYF
jgi:type IV secretory pathway component VirB8